MIVPNDTNPPNAPTNGNGQVSGGLRGLPLLTLPPKVPKQSDRPTQSNIPDDRAVRDRLNRLATAYIQKNQVVPPLVMDELRDHTVALRRLAGVDALFDDYIAVLVNNAAWSDTLAQIPYDRRLLLVPKCLRLEELCPAPFDEFGLLCRECNLCSLHDLTVEAERLGYAVLVAEGSAIVRKMVETGRIEAIVGVSCLNVLEKCFPHLEATAVPGVAIPLLQDDCANTSVDLDWVWDVIHLTSDDHTYRLNLDQLKRDVQSWFELPCLETLMGPAQSDTERIARDWLTRAGKRWRPYLTTCVYLASKGDRSEQQPPIPDDLRKLAVAVECFHKASLIHDDIEDDDDLRYGQPALHTQHGMPVALNVGDFLLGEGYRLIGELDHDPALKVDMLRTAADGHLSLSRGQGAELCWARQPGPLSSLQVLDIFRQKTAPAFEVALRLGAFYAGVDAETLQVLHEYSESLGIAYQIRDDLEDFSGDGDSHDLRDLRPSVILSIAHKRAVPGPEADLIASLWSRKCNYDDVAEEVQRILSQRGVTEKASELLEAYRVQAIRSLRILGNPTLKGLLRRVVGKIFGEHAIEGYCSEFEARNAPSGQAGAETAA
ncbi:MAG: polyprenyl synthetase family protein [Phycisphaerae bacterium]